MAVSGSGIKPTTPFGAELVDGGVIFRTWAPEARDVYVVTDPDATANWTRWTPDPEHRLLSLGDGTWAGFVPGLEDGTPYLFWIRGQGSEGFKRDPYARELAKQPFFPNCPCLVRPAHAYPWHDTGWQPPAFHDLIIYQLHVGVFWRTQAQGPAYSTFLDVVHRLPYLKALGVTAVQLLPIQEYDGDFGLGYNGLDYFSPEMTYQVDAPDLPHHLAVLNEMLLERGLPPLVADDVVSGPNQLKCLVDLCHLHSLAVIFDLVYNHAGGGFGERSLYFYDRQPFDDGNRSLYFTDKGWAGGKVFAYWQEPVCRFLIDNALFFLDEYHIDGIRYDEVTVISHHGGDGFCQDITAAVRGARPQAVQIAEYWDWDRARPVEASPQGLGFDAAMSDRLRNAIRSLLAQAAGGAHAHLDLDVVADALRPPPGFPAAWRAVQCLEDHDIVRWDFERLAPRAPRVATLADPSNARSWYARSRSRVATVLLLTAPGIPMLFMGQEVLEDKPWHDDVENWAQFLISWDALGSDRHMQDFLTFMHDLVALRRAQPALRGEGLRVLPPDAHNRVIVMHRWVEGEGSDVVVVATLSEATLEDYRVDMPWPGWWREVFNSDFYDHCPNPQVTGNGGWVRADGPGIAYHWSARLCIPANGAIVLARP